MKRNENPGLSHLKPSASTQQASSLAEVCWILSLPSFSL